MLFRSGLGFWILLIIVVVILPLRDYLRTGRLWSLSSDRKSYFLFKGKKAWQVIFIRLAVLVGCMDLFVSMILFNRIAWEGALVFFVSLILGAFAPDVAKRIPRKNASWRR